MTSTPDPLREVEKDCGHLNLWTCCRTCIEEYIAKVRAEAIKERDKWWMKQQSESIQHAYDLAKKESYAEGFEASASQMRERAKEKAKEWWRTRRQNPEELFDDLGHLPMSPEKEK